MFALRKGGGHEFSQETNSSRGCLKTHGDSTVNKLSSVFKSMI